MRHKKEMTLPEFKRQSDVYKELRDSVPVPDLVALVFRAIAEAYQAGLEQGTTRRIMAGKK